MKGNPQEFVRLPKTRMYGVLFGSLIQRVMRSFEGEDASTAFKGIGSALATNFAPTNPIESNLFSPATFNIATNKDFAGRNIVPMGMELNNTPAYLQYDERTSELSKALANVEHELGLDGIMGKYSSPMVKDYLIDSYTGVIGDFLLPATTKDNTDSLGKKMVDVVTDRFKADSLYSNQALTDFYDNYDKLQGLATERNITENLPTNGKANIVTDEEGFEKQIQQRQARNFKAKQGNKSNWSDTHT